MKIRFTKREKKLDEQVNLLTDEKAVLLDHLHEQRVLIDKYRLGIESVEKNYSALRHRLQQVAADRYRLQRSDDQQRAMRRVAADGMLIERDELLARASRLTMRVQGLGFDPDGDE